MTDNQFFIGIAIFGAIVFAALTRVEIESADLRLYDTQAGNRWEANHLMERVVSRAVEKKYVANGHKLDPDWTLADIVSPEEFDLKHGDRTTYPLGFYVKSVEPPVYVIYWRDAMPATSLRAKLIEYRADFATLSDEERSKEYDARNARVDKDDDELAALPGLSPWLDKEKFEANKRRWDAIHAAHQIGRYVLAVLALCAPATAILLILTLLVVKPRWANLRRLIAVILLTPSWVVGWALLFIAILPPVTTYHNGSFFVLAPSFVAFLLCVIGGMVYPKKSERELQLDARAKLAAKPA